MVERYLSCARLYFQSRASTGGKCTFCWNSKQCIKCASKAGGSIDVQMQNSLSLFEREINPAYPVHRQFWWIWSDEYRLSNDPFDFSNACYPTKTCSCVINQAKPPSDTHCWVWGEVFPPRAAVLAQGKTNDSLAWVAWAWLLWFPGKAPPLPSNQVRAGVICSLSSCTSDRLHGRPRPRWLRLQRQERVVQRLGPHFSRQQQRDKLWAELLTRHFETPSYFERIRISHRHSGLCWFWPSGGKESDRETLSK